jgi:protein-tyrosine phosphatase
MTGVATTSLFAFIGKWYQLGASNMSEFGDIVVVCTANICRSPMGAALLRHALMGKAEPLKSLTVVSAGVSAREGDRVTENSVTALKKVGIDISDHTSQPLTQAMLDRALLVLCMTEAHRAMIQVSADPAPKHVYLFREFTPKGADKEIVDPYGGPLPMYESSRDEMVEAIPSILQFIKTEIVPVRKK